MDVAAWGYPPQWAGRMAASDAATGGWRRRRDCRHTSHTCVSVSTPRECVGAHTVEGVRGSAGEVIGEACGEGVISEACGEGVIGGA